MDCVVDSDGRNPACGRGAPLPRTLQFAELGGFLWLVWWLGAAAGGTQAAAWLTLGLALMTTTVLLQSVDYLMTEMTCLLLTTAATACGVQAVTQKQRSLWAAAAGALLALAACTRPAFYYLIFVCIAAGGAMALRARRGLWPLAAFAGAAFATLAPWVVRNALVMGHPALSFGYAGEVLVQRIAFDTMNGREYALSYLCWLPDGPGLGRALVGPHACDRFAWDDQPTSFYVLGHVHMLAETLARAGGNEHYLAYLLHTYILRMPVWHMLVSIPLALRGAYIDHWWGFVLLPVALAATASALRHGRAAYLIIALPAWFMLALNATIAVNQTRYNLMLIPVYAVAGAMLLLRWRIAARLGAQTSTEASATIPEG
jgi:4-amino-4-deoxy-L-arabinose transferase-like glycosyltransferase